MTREFLDDYLLYKFVSAAHAAQATENETGIGMSWADFDGSGELEGQFPKLPEIEEEEFEEQLKKSANDPEIVHLFEQMDDVESEEELKELQADVKEKAEPYMRKFMK